MPPWIAGEPAERLVRARIRRYEPEQRVFADFARGWPKHVSPTYPAAFAIRALNASHVELRARETGPCSPAKLASILRHAAA